MFPTHSAGSFGPVGMRNHSADGPEAWASTAEEVPWPQSRLPELPLGLEVTFWRMNKGVWVFPPPCTLMSPALCVWRINAGKLDQKQFTLRLSATLCSALTGAVGLRSSPNKHKKSGAHVPAVRPYSPVCQGGYCTRATPHSCLQWVETA